MNVERLILYPLALSLSLYGYGNGLGMFLENLPITFGDTEAVFAFAGYDNALSSGREYSLQVFKGFCTVCESESWW